MPVDDQYERFAPPPAPLTHPLDDSDPVEEQKKSRKEVVNIINSQTYLKSLKNTLLDKSFFMCYLDKDIKVIVDFGCADGSLIEFLKYNWPQYEYVGIEKNKEFRELARSKGITVFESDEEYNNECDVNPVCVHLNFSSVLHEIFCYEVDSVLSHIITSISPHSISVRDMLFNYNYMDLTNSFSKDDMIMYKEKVKQLKFYQNFLNQLIDNEKYQTKWKDYLNSETNEIKRSLAGIVEFLLKYIYDENWKREVSEKYFSLKMRDITYKDTHHFGGYLLDFYNSYKIPYLVNRWKKDFNFKENDSILSKIDTHFNAFYTIDPAFSDPNRLPDPEMVEEASAAYSYDLTRLCSGYYDFANM